MKLNALKFGLAAGITGSAIMLFSSLAFKLFLMRRVPAVAPGTEQAMFQMQQYMSLPWGQMLISAVWLFATYFFIAWFFAWLYNKLL